ncbi:hypothetical protein GCM10010960_08200 [Arenimonas maotaiensis]|uniref:PEP-CTERM sorting domain-containing protein n=1 Tax=Arenimonas maotaiensis TaxID=1446479 RepID=A0A917CIP6_9GAMM|nr:hypothetical protein [Arenimonas maotaiensis]GGF88700.1 hypothetical protein GCM10010960_08200 [Arenimonas maotaiensis]
MRKLIPLLIVAVGAALMAFKIVEDSEPGAIPLLLVLIGGAWYLIGRRRS